MLLGLTVFGPPTIDDALQIVHVPRAQEKFLRLIVGEVEQFRGCCLRCELPRWYRLRPVSTPWEYPSHAMGNPSLLRISFPVLISDSAGRRFGPPVQFILVGSGDDSARQTVGCAARHSSVPSWFDRAFQGAYAAKGWSGQAT